MGLKFEEIKELIDLVARHRLTGIEIEAEDFRLCIDGYKQAAPVASAPAVPPPPAAPAPAATEVPAAPPAKGKSHSDVHQLTSPIVGTFYRAPNPEAPPFVEIGSRVKQGQTLCIVEAMKLMNEIEADVDGVIVDVFTKNAQPVEFGEPLFAIKTD